MTVGWRSTTLKLAERHCPAALAFYERGTPYDRSIFATGTAAHACLEDVGKASVAAGRWLEVAEAEPIMRATCERLIREGRDFEGDREPPMRSDRVWAGRDLALAYQAEEPMPHTYKYEEGLAVNRQWMPCPYDAGAWLRCRIDAVGTVLPGLLDDDFEEGGAVLEVRDYKSAYTADERELESLQRKIQGVLAWDRWGEGHESLRLVVINFRLRRRFETTVFPHEPQGAEVLARWRADIESEIAAREAQRGPDGSLPATPGACCDGCPYILKCAPAMSYLAKARGMTDPKDLATAYAVAKALIDHLDEPLRMAAADEAIHVAGGRVGFAGETQRVLGRGAVQILADAWNRKAHPPDVETAQAQVAGLLSALGLGVANAEKLLTFLYRGSDEEREKRVRLLATAMSSKVRRVFGVHPNRQIED